MASSMVVSPYLFSSTQFLAEEAVPKTLSWGAPLNLSLASGCSTHRSAPRGDPKS